MKFFVVEGLDGSGKSTQIGLLKDFFTKRKTAFKYLHFPRTDSPVFGELIAKFLRGELGKIEHVNPYLVALIYAGDRMDAASMIQRWLSEDTIVMLDRYVHSNIAFQCAKLERQSDRKRLKDWINHLEYEYFRIPKPDLSLFLDVPFTFTETRLSQHRKGDDREYLQGMSDIHEANIGFQKKVREVYLWQVEQETDFRLVECSGDKGEMLSPDEIFDRVINALDFN